MYIKGVELHMLTIQFYPCSSVGEYVGMVLLYTMYAHYIMAAISSAVV